ncbi:MAG: hypothetical protein R3185_09190, partial [Candidatus Thermoplasmatota archaeon]|nr:hypothetical protein [Candidatus Thermoplasmatota archaeon]
AATITTLATAEILLSARDVQMTQLASRGLPAIMLERARSHTRTLTLGLLGATVLLGGLLIGVYVGLREPLSTLVADPDLIWVPAIMGLVAAIAVFLASRGR